MILDGRIIKQKGLERLAKIPQKPHLVIFQVGDRADSNIYIRQKKLFGEKVGVQVSHVVYPVNVDEKKLINDIAKISAKKDVQGVIVQMPLPKKINTQKVIDAIAPEKDVDGLTSANTAKLWQKDPSAFVPATARGVISMLQYYKVPIKGANIVVIGRSNLVGRPLALTLTNLDATVTVCHSKTKDIPSITKWADIVICATGTPRFFGAKYFSKGQVIIDVGITAVDFENSSGNNLGKNIVGDVDFAKVQKLVKAISPVPGGVGQMTVLSLFENLYKSSI